MRGGVRGCKSGETAKYERCGTTAATSTATVAFGKYWELGMSSARRCRVVSCDSRGPLKRQRHFRRRVSVGLLTQDGTQRRYITYPRFYSSAFTIGIAQEEIPHPPASHTMDRHVFQKETTQSSLWLYIVSGCYIRFVTTFPYPLPRNNPSSRLAQQLSTSTTTSTQ